MNLSFIFNFGWILRVLVIRGGNKSSSLELEGYTDCPQSAQPQSVAGAPNPRVSLPREGGDVRSKIILNLSEKDLGIGHVFKGGLGFERKYKGIRLRGPAL